MSNTEQVLYSFALLVLTGFVVYATSMAPFVGLRFYELFPEEWLGFAVFIPSLFFATAMSALLTIHVGHKQGISTVLLLCLFVVPLILLFLQLSVDCAMSMSPLLTKGVCNSFAHTPDAVYAIGFFAIMVPVSFSLGAPAGFVIGVLVAVGFAS